MYAVARQVQIQASNARVWECLTQPALLARWFADVERFELGQPFRLNFGDGDFFAGTIKEWDAPSCLRVEWRFMDLGARYDVAFYLTPLSAAQTELTVVDRGCLTLDELSALRDGWGDFLGRLGLFVQKGQSTRLTWSQAIGVSALLPGSIDLPAALRSADWWATAFPDAQVRTLEAPDRILMAAFGSRVWGGLETEARITLERTPAGACLSVLHEGWPRLAQDVRLSERARYAERWQAALKSLEDGVGAEAGVPTAHLASPRWTRGDRS